MPANLRKQWYKETLAIDIEAIKSSAKEKAGVTLAALWLKQAADEAIDDFLEAEDGEWVAFQNSIRKYASE